MLRRLIFWVVLQASISAAQTLIHVNLNRVVTRAPETAEFLVSVWLPEISGIPEALELFAPLGVTTADFVRFDWDLRPEGGGYRYQFAIRTPCSNLSQIQSRLRRLTDTNPAVYFYLSAVSATFPETADSKLYADMMAEARKKAAETAAATGLVLGRIIGLSDTRQDLYSPSPVFFGSQNALHTELRNRVTYTMSVIFSAQ